MSSATSAEMSAASTAATAGMAATLRVRNQSRARK
jgi:hypothetical protein